MDRPIQRLFAFKCGHHLSQHGSLFPRLTRPPHESLADEFLRVFLAFPGKAKTLVVGRDEDEIVIEFSSAGDHFHHPWRLFGLAGVNPFNSRMRMRR